MKALIKFLKTLNLKLLCAFYILIKVRDLSICSTLNKREKTLYKVA